MVPSPAPVRLGLVGLGWWGGVLARAARATGQAEVVACHARTPETREAFADEHGCRAEADLGALLAAPDVDGLLVATPHRTHLDLIRHGADAGKHLFVEKPLALSAEEGRAAVEAAERAGVTLQVGHHRRRLPATRQLARHVHGGDLGTLLSLHATMHRPVGWTQGWRADPAESPAGAMTALGVHMVDTFHYLAGPVRRLSASTASLVDDHPLEDMTSVRMVFDSGAIGTLNTSLMLPERIRLGAYGTAAAVWSDRDGTRLEWQGVDDPEPTGQAVEGPDAVEDELAEFAACVRGEGRPETGGVEGLAVVAVLDAIVASAERDGAPVDVERVAAA